MRTSTRLIMILVVFGGLIAVGRIIQKNFFPDIDLSSENVIVRESYHLQGIHDNDLVALGETVGVGSDGRVAGDAAFVGETVRIDGHIDGSLTVLAETIVIAPGSDIDGNATLIGETITLDGVIGGDLTIMGEALRLNADVAPGGSIIACGSKIDDTRSGERVTAILPCSHLENLQTWESIVPFYDNGQFNLPDVDVQITGLGTFTLLLSLLSSLSFSALAVLIVTLFPRQINTIEEAVAASPRRLIGLGVATFILSWGVVIAYIVLLAAVPVIGLILLPLVLLAALIFFGMILLGWVTIALYVGDWVLRRFAGIILPPLAATAIGSISLFVIWHLIMFAPLGLLINFAALIIVGSIGLGATVLTRIGTRPLPRKTTFVLQ